MAKSNIDGDVELGVGFSGKIILVLTLVFKEKSVILSNSLIVSLISFSQM